MLVEVLYERVDNVHHYLFHSTFKILKALQNIHQISNSYYHSIPISSLYEETVAFIFTEAKIIIGKSQLQRIRNNSYKTTYSTFILL